jgi:vacuolar-type H+-ATPase subunit I/STV1
MRCLFTQFIVVSAIAAIREMDGIFDRIPVIRWEIPAAGLLIFAIGYAWRHRATLGPQVDYFVRTAPFGVLWAGFIVIALIAQLVGHGRFLELVMGDDYHRDYKRVIEEITELFGYLIFLLGAIETVLFDDKDHRNSVHFGNGQ